MVIDASAIVAILFDEPERLAFLNQLKAQQIKRISAATVVEVGVMLTRKRRSDAEVVFEALLTAAGITVEPVTADQARSAIEAFRRYGKGCHKAHLNFCDTFSYALAKATGEPLLFKGDDFSQTDVTPAV